MRSEDTQFKLCEAAVALLCEVGYGNLTTALIAQRAGVSKGAQAHHFPTKDDILVAAFRHLLADWAERRAAYAPVDGGNLADLQQALWRSVFGRPDYLALIEVMLAARHHPPLRDRLREAMTGWIATRDDTFARLVPLTDPDELADFLSLNFCVLRGLAIYQDLTPDKALPERVLGLWTEIASLFLAQRAAPEAPPTTRRKGAKR